MIDFVKLNHLAISLGIKDLLAFPIQVEEDTGAILHKRTSATFKNLIFTITPGEYQRVKVKGSIHKFANQGLHNFDRFTWTRFCSTYEELSELIFPRDQVNLLEFGVNLLTPFDPSIFIRNLIAYKRKRVNLTDRNGELYSEVRFSQYRLKIYHKGLQFNQGNILRIELRFEKMENLFPEGLFWGDLRDPDTWRYLGTRLLKTLQDLIYFDPGIDISSIPSQRERAILKEGNNPRFWETLEDSHPERKRDQFQHLVRKHGPTFGDLSRMVEEEISLLIDTRETEKVAISDHFSLSKNDTSLSGTCKKVAISSPLLSCQFSPPPSVDQGNQVNTGRKVCQVTGLDISLQKPDSKFLSFSGLRWLLLTEPVRFKEMAEERLSDRWINQSLDIQIREIAHSIRNEYFNPKHNAIRDIEKVLSYPALFDQTPYIRADRRRLAGLDG